MTQESQDFAVSESGKLGWETGQSTQIKRGTKIPRPINPDGTPHNPLATPPSAMPEVNPAPIPSPPEAEKPNPIREIEQMVREETAAAVKAIRPVQQETESLRLDDPRLRPTVKLTDLTESPGNPAIPPSVSPPSDTPSVVAPPPVPSSVEESAASPLEPSGAGIQAIESIPKTHPFTEMTEPPPELHTEMPQRWKEKLADPQFQTDQMRLFLGAAGMAVSRLNDNGSQIAAWLALIVESHLESGVVDQLYSAIWHSTTPAGLWGDRKTTFIIIRLLACDAVLRTLIDTPEGQET